MSTSSIIGSLTTLEALNQPTLSEGSTLHIELRLNVMIGTLVKIVKQLDFKCDLCFLPALQV